MFTDFFYLLRSYKIPVTPNEWLVLMRALDYNLVDCNLNRFYLIARSILIKNESYFDLYDQCFLHFFKGCVEPTPIDDQIHDWLNRTPLERFFSKEELDKLKALSLEELNRMFEERMREQKDQHHGGNRWIGTGGTSPFGHGGFHPSGIRVGGNAGNRSAVKIAGERNFRNHRHDLTLDIRQIQVALKKLRELRRFGAADELDMDGTIQKTCNNAGDIDLVFRSPRKNQTRVILLMDAGGTMDPFADLVSQLFSAAHQSTHFKDFRHYYFHNCVYSRVYTDMARKSSIPTADLLRRFDSNYKLIVVGDAWMSPYELFYENGAIDFFSSEHTPGIEWLRRLNHHFTKSIWLNPERQNYWNADSIHAIRQIFPMFPMTIDGLQEAISKLL